MLQYDWKKIVENEQKTPTLPITPFELNLDNFFIITSETEISIPESRELVNSDANFEVYLKNKFNISAQVS